MDAIYAIPLTSGDHHAALDELLEEHRPAWMLLAACRGADPELFFPEKGEMTAPARQVCAVFPVAVQCRAYAAQDDLHGVWGGTTRTERKKMPNAA